ncbi:hypothetical protein AgCh_006959 [Apium graveolens]
MISLGFGYYDDDFKVIAIAPLANAYFVSVYSLNTDSWNMIQRRFNVDVGVKDEYYYRCNHVYQTKFVDGKVYLIGSEDVICFDLSNETIRVIPYPKELGPRVGNRITTETYGDSIAIFKFKRQSQSLTMWILNEKSSFVPVW